MKKMEKDDWRDYLRSCFENIRVLENCQVETFENFRQFCEFITEPAFESLAEELKEYGIKARFKKRKGHSIGFCVNFVRSRVDNFHYIISLPKNAVEMKLQLTIKGRRTSKSPLEESKVPFMENVAPASVMKITKEELILDIIDRYRNFAYEAITSPR